MITVACNPTGLYVVATIAKGTKFNTAYSTTEMLQRIKDWGENPAGGGAGSLNVDADNPRLHRAKRLMNSMEANMIRKAIHPSYSPDLTPSDFFLFGDVKRRLSECSLDVGS
jgi:hypothetical protein